MEGGEWYLRRGRLQGADKKEVEAFRRLMVHV